MRMPGEKSLEWTRIASFQTASSTRTDTISGITNYSEILVTLTPNGSPERVLGSIIIPSEYFFAGTSDPGNGQHQLEGGGNRSCGISYIGNNKIKLYTGTYSGIAVYTR